MLFLALLCWAPALRAWDRDESPLWPDGTVRLDINLDGPRSLLGDGRTYDQVVGLAATTWNNYLGRLQFTTVLNSSVPVDNHAENGRNNVTFGTQLGGALLGDGVLAATLIDYDDTRRRETDIVFNSSETWDSFRGPLGYSASSPIDLLRVALHELGHVLGLDHPDEAGQYVTAIMNSHASSTDALTDDDKDGAAELYGPGPGYAPPLPVVGSLYDVTLEVGQSLSFNVYQYRGRTFQWFKDGVEISGATEVSFNIASVALTDAGSYTFRATNTGGSVTTNAARVTVNPARPPRINYGLSNQTVTLGDSFSFYASVDGSSPLTVQWYRDDQLLANQTGWSFSTIASAQTAGRYTFVATNAAGTVTSSGAMVTVRPLLPPFSSNVPSDYQVRLGDQLSLDAGVPWYSSGWTYQWYKDGAPVPGATSSSLFIRGAQATDAGDYFAVMTNLAGSSTSGTRRVRVVAATTADAVPWKDARRLGDIYYFLFEFPARVERYDLATRTWLEALPVTGGAPAAFLPTADGIFLAVGSSVRRLPLAGGEPVPVGVLPSTPTFLGLMGRFLVGVSSTYSSVSFTALDLTTGGVAGTANTPYSLSGAHAVAPGLGRLFGRSTGVSPSDIGYITLNPDGTFGTSAESPYHGDFGAGDRTFLLANEAHVADASGTVYRTDNLTFTASLGGAFVDLEEAGDGSVTVLRGGSLDFYDASYAWTGTQMLTAVALRVALVGDGIATFAPLPTGRRVAVAWQERAPGGDTLPAAVSPEGRAFPASQFFIDRAGVLHILSKVDRNLFRWSTTEQRFLDSIPLRGAPDFLSYSRETDRAYLGYAGGLVTEYRPAESGLERTFARAPVALLGLAAAGEHVVIVDPSGAWQAYYSFDSAGQQVARKEWVTRSREFAWNPLDRRLYHFRDDMSPNDLEYVVVNADGTFGATGDSPYHGEIATTYPIRISPDGAAVLLGSGRFYATSTLRQVAELPVELEDAAWLGSTPYTVRSTLAGAEISKWDPLSLFLTRTATGPGVAKRLFELSGNRLLLVSSQRDFLVFSIYDAALNLLSRSRVRSSDAVRMINLSARAWVGTGDQVVIPGFVVSGTQPKRVLIRAVGPSLASAGVTGFLADPRITLYNGQGAVMETNDDWSSLSNLSDFIERGAATGANPFVAGSRDAGLLATLQPGAYSVHTRGAAAATGVSVVEIFDADPTDPSSRLVNISARARVGSGENVLIAGFVVQGSAPKKILVHGLGPQLAQVLSGTLTNPSLTLYNQAGTAIASNDDWVDTAELRQAWQRIGAATLTAGSKDAVLFQDLPPGLYSVILRGDSAATGVGMIELYEVPEE